MKEASNEYVWRQLKALLPLEEDCQSMRNRLHAVNQSKERVHTKLSGLRTEMRRPDGMGERARERERDELWQ
jgi:hypothetical protein